MIYAFCTCNSDIALDGFAFEIIPKEFHAKAASCEAVGINIGWIVGSSVITALSSIEFSNLYLYSN